MTEIAVGLVVDKLIPLLTNEAYLLSDIHKEVEEIKCDLEFLMAFLRDADTIAEGDNHGVKVWVQKLRRVAFEIEDVIDEYIHLMTQQQDAQERQFIDLFKRGACLLRKLKPRRDLTSKICDLRQRVRDINANSAAYGFNSLMQGFGTTAQNNTWYDPRKDSCFLKETEVVGVTIIRDELIARVEGESPQRSVISLVGMGGLGKTTLAHQVYVRVKGCFECHAWIEVSRSYNKVELLQTLLRKFYQAREEPVPEGIDVMDHSTLIEKMGDYLQGKRYFVVFDDVWNSTFWADIKNALPDDNENFGRILITTRYENVANFCKESSFVHIHKLQHLSQDAAWELFCSKAFRYDYQGHCPANLVKLSHEILERCGGLPLAIVVIAGLLSTKKKTAYEWGKLLNSLSSELTSNECLASIEKILSLSYNDLPYYLKSCFLYFGIFPEDYSIRRWRLIRQWIAEGFVKPKKDKTSEEVAEEYLAELINRSLVQVSEMTVYGKPRRCRIHGLLHEITVKKMEDLHFCQVLSRSDSKFRGLTRRVSMLHSSSDAFQSNFETSPVRSLFIFVKDEMHHSLERTMPSNFKLLKVLDFEEAKGLDHLPEDVGMLFHLRYLSIRGSKVQFLPHSIGKLENLETLDLKFSLVYDLPVEIYSLQKLRHLLADPIDNRNVGSFQINIQRGVNLKKGIGRLKALQKLYFLEANIHTVDLLEELSELTEMRKLGINKLRSQDGKTLCGSIQKMDRLETLIISAIGENETLDLESLSSPPRFLQRLWLSGHLEKLPEWIPKLQNLVRVRISWSKLEVDLLRALQNLPNLLALGMAYDAYYGEKLHFEKGGFPCLKVLHIFYFSRLNSIVIQERALCNLEEFYIGPCPQLKEMPSGFQHLTNLKRLQFHKMPARFMMFQNFQSLEIVLDFRFFFNISGKLFFMNLKDVTELQTFIREHNEVDWNSLSFGEVLSKYFSRR